MNFVLEGNINFYDELNKLDTDDDDDENTCLLTNLPLDKNSIKLPCNHEFNFFPLYKEVVLQKTHSPTSYLNNDKLTIDQIKCPYCRQKFNFLLPHIRLNKEMRFISGVNTPEKMCLSFHTCQYMFKNGKNKGNICSKSAYYDVTGCFCGAHHTSMSKHSSSSSNDIISTTIPTVVPTPTIIHTAIHKCIGVLQSGKRMGQICGAKINDINNTHCKRHTPK
jgi:hypothetical protein